MTRLITSNEILKKTEAFIDSSFGTPAGEKINLIEVGPIAEFNRIHIRRATHLGRETLPRELSVRFPNRAVTLILYSGGSESSGLNGDPVLYSIAKNFFEVGYFNLFLFLNGKSEWLSQGLWAETSLVNADGFRTEDLIEEPVSPILRAA